MTPLELMILIKHNYMPNTTQDYELAMLLQERGLIQHIICNSWKLTQAGQAHIESIKDFIEEQLYDAG